MTYTKQEKQKLERVISVFAERLKESDAFDLVWSDKVGYVLLDIAPDYDYVDTARRVDTIIRKSGGDQHDPGRIHGAMICALENARQHGHLYLEVNTLIAESLQFLNEPIPLPQMQVRRAEVCADALPQRSCVRTDGHAPQKEHGALPAIYQPESTGVSACGNEG